MWISNNRNESLAIRSEVVLRVFAYFPALHASFFVYSFLGFINFFEFFFGSKAYVFAQCCYAVGVMLKSHFAVCSFHFIVGGIGRDTQNLVGLLRVVLFEVEHRFENAGI